MYIDLYPIRDERTILKNKGKGWYWHYIDCGYSRPRYRDMPELIGNPDDFPGLHHLYLRFNWRDINPKKGVYDFSYLDSIMDEYGARGYAFSLRMCSYQTEIHRWGNCQHASPDYVRECGANGFFKEITDAADPDRKFDHMAWEPDYGDPIFLSYVEEAMHMLGQKYGNDKRVAYVDVGTFGKYGEGHTQSMKHSKETLIRHIDITRAAFPNTLVLVNDDMIRHDESLTAELTEYCIQRGIGIRDDSIVVAGPARSVPTYDTLRDPRMFDPFSDKFPVDIEFAHAELCPPDVWRQGLPALESLRRTKATFAGFHDYPRRFYEANYDLCEYAANRLGYWFRPDSIDIRADGGSFTVTNLGWARSYRDMEMRLTLECENGSLYELGRIGGSIGWIEGSTNTESFTFDKPIPSGNYSVKLGLFDTDGTSIKMALDQKLYDGNYYTVGNITL